jgi:acetoacetyl-CoA synthetase
MKPIWTPSRLRIDEAKQPRFQKLVEKNYSVTFKDYAEMHSWSIDYPEKFWKAVWQFGELKASVLEQTVFIGDKRFSRCRWFDGMQLNFAENLLRYRDQRIAFVSVLEDGQRREISYADLYAQVARAAVAMRGLGVQPGDRIAGLMPNVIETAVAMLAATSLGAIWSSCSPDFGVNGVMDRFGQIQPKLLFACESYFYNGKAHQLSNTLGEICEQINALEQLVVVPVIDKDRASNLAAELNGVSWDVFLEAGADAGEIEFAQLPFNHPLYILYSSGTTGVPKCIVHGAGGTLLQHTKEYLLHFDVHRSDVFFYYTTCGWTMWNILISSLVTGCTAVLYDGSPFYPKATALIDLIDQENISVFGVSAKYLSALEKENLEPITTHQLSSLKTILSTGSPLSHESFQYVYKHFKQEVCLSSICGGTDIISAFIAGSPTLAVYEGELQCKGLGMSVEIWNEQGESVEQQKGELVCTRPFPSCPIGFWRDDGGKKFNAAYFERFDGVWAQGDYAEITQNGGFIVYGRSDAVLNPGGVRIGTAEIYRQVDKFNDIIESVCVGQQWQDDVRVILFVVLREPLQLDDALVQKIRSDIRANTTPRHVPAKIIQVDDIPKTISGKIAELAVRNTIHGEPVKNQDALANPEALNNFISLNSLS